ncbi:MAG TPA: hypothetical protein VF369_02225 [candidate division Zixibacteria bacterium]
MDRKIFFKDPANLKMEIEKLISFEEKDNLLRLKKQLEGKATGKSLSKYSRVLSCSYAQSSIETEMARGASVQNKRSPRAIGDSTSVQ